MDKKADPKRIVGVVMMGVCFVAFSIIAVVGVLFPSDASVGFTMLSIVAMFVLTVVALRTAGDSDYVKARQADQTLALASETITFMRQGLSAESAQAVCELLLPAVASISVAITDHEKVLGFAGVDKENHLQNTPIQTDVTREVLEDGVTRIVDSPEGIGFDHDSGTLKAAIIVPLVVNKSIVGTLKFYYGAPNKIDETQLAIAEGFAQLLSAQLSLSYLEQQTELATRMELKMLQTQINPHFLFNTINTIAAFTRTDPAKARTMLREFALYYRRLLENSEDLIPLSAEIDQTSRYLMFQRARFGEDAIEMQIEIEEGLGDLGVPAFIVQPIVENAVGHGRREEGTLHILVTARREGDSVIIEVRDDGVGIEPERLDNIIDGGSKTGMGIALGNVDARLKGFFGSMSGLHIESEYGVGTTVYLSLYNALIDEDEDF